jgi:hypothetical protein
MFNLINWSTGLVINCGEGGVQATNLHCPVKSVILLAILDLRGVVAVTSAINIVADV